MELTATINAAGQTQSDLETALEEALDLIREGNTEGFDESEGGSFNFEIADQNNPVEYKREVEGMPIPAYVPDAAHRFFVFCPQDTKFYYFKTAAERDLYADKVVIEAFCDDGWQEGIENVIAGELSHVCGKMAGEPLDFEMQTLGG